MCHEQNITLVVYRVQGHNTAYNLATLENPRYVFKCFRTSKQSEPENYSTARNYLFNPVERPTNQQAYTTLGSVKMNNQKSPSSEKGSFPMIFIFFLTFN